MRKPKVLMNTEASWLATGYSTYSREVLQRLHDSGEFEVAELASYYHPGNHDDRMKALDTPWKVYANIPEDEERSSLYNHKSSHQFGEFGLDETLLEFRPDVVFSIRDVFMDEHIERSPFRKFFYWAYMPTCDGIPQPENWLSTYANADAILTYTDWAAGVLRSEGGGTVSVVGTASPGVDTEVFKPRERGSCRRKLGIDEDDIIIGTCMRNQIRKLYPDLIREFRNFLLEAPQDIAKRSYLYLHVTYPDRGWDIPRMIKQSGISHRIIVTYKCPDCSNVMARHYSDARIHCQACGSANARMPSVRNGVGRESLATIMGAFDAYVQYSALEGFGMPMVEAAACGVPIFATDYSAMEDVVRKLGGYPIRVERYNEDVEFGRLWAQPDGQDFARQLVKFLSLDPERRAEKSKEARQGVPAHYTWDLAARSWAKVFRKVPLRPHTETWDSPSRTFKPKVAPGAFRSNEEFVRWAVVHRLGRPDLAGSYFEMRLLRDLNWGSRPPSVGNSLYNEDSLRGMEAEYEDFGENELLQQLDMMREAFNMWELRRVATGGKKDVVA